MTKAELIARVASRKNLPRGLAKKTVARLIEAAFTEIGDYFIRTRPNRSNPPRFTFPGFGTFTKRRRGARVVRNPRTGAPIAVPSTCTVVFAPGQELKRLLNRDLRVASPQPRLSASARAAQSSGDAPTVN